MHYMPHCACTRLLPLPSAGTDRSSLFCRFMVANNFLQDVASCPLVFPLEGALGAASGAAKPVLPPVEEILDVVDSDDEGMDVGVDEGLDTVSPQEGSGALPRGDEGTAAGDQAAGDVGLEAGDVARDGEDKLAGGAEQQPTEGADMVVEAAAVV